MLSEKEWRIGLSFDMSNKLPWFDVVFSQLTHNCKEPECFVAKSQGWIAEFIFLRLLVTARFFKEIE